MADIERESMEYDVVIVGAGPAGPRRRDPPEAARPRPLRGGAGEGLRGRRPHPLRRRARPHRPRRAAARLARAGRADHDRGHRGPLLPARRTPARCACPNWPMPRLMSNHGNYIVSMGNVCRWLAAQAEALGVEIFPGMAASALVYGEDGEVARRRRRRVRPRQGPPARARATSPAWSCSASTCLLAEGVRGSLAKQVIARFGLVERPRAAEIRPRHEGDSGRSRPRGPPAGPGHPHHGLAARLERRRRVVHVPPGEQPGLRRLRRAPELREPLALSLHGVPALQAPSADRRAC